MPIVTHVRATGEKIADFPAWSWCRGLGARGVAFKPFINHVFYFLILVSIFYHSQTAKILRRSTTAKELMYFKIMQANACKYKEKNAATAN